MSDSLEALRACEERFRNLIARNADAIVVVDRLGMVRFINPAAEVLFGRPAEDFIGHEFGFPVLSGETTEVDLVGQDSATRVAEMRVVDTEWDNEPAFLAVLRDCTDRKRVEDERLQLLREQMARAEAEQALRERDAFLATASHELKTPLSTLSTATQLLRRHLDRELLPESDHARAALTVLDDQARRLARLVTHLLDFADINSGALTLSKQHIDLTHLVASVVSERQATTTTHSLALQSAGRVTATVDVARIERLVANLLDNAIQYSPNGGVIEIDLVPDGRMACLSVRDHGLGIPSERRWRLFERFTRAHADDYISGLGLGLFISRHVAEQHGGRLDAEFPPDGGSLFVLRLPRAESGTSVAG